MSVSSQNLTGGVAGSIPYQNANGDTEMTAAGIPGQTILSSGSGAPYWGSPSFNPLVFGRYLDGNGKTEFPGSYGATLDVDADTANTPDKVVARDSSGNFAAGTITADLSGNATTASALETARTINGVAFDGTSNINITDPNAVAKAGSTMTGFLTLHSAPTANLHAATKQYVDEKVSAALTLWAGSTTLANVQATYVSYPTGTRVAFWEERNYSRPANSNGGSVSISDRYRRVVKKNSNGSWSNAG